VDDARAGRDAVSNNLTKWLMSYNVGMSSKAMAGAIFGVPGGGTYHPHDPSDFNRCLIFLSDVPESLPLLHVCRRLSPQWEALVGRWDEVEQTFLNEVGLNWCKADRAPKTYALMQEIYSRATEAT
jgi:hypothetical protein